MEYDLPKALCGVPVGRSTIEPLFPPGKELTDVGGELADGQDRSSCSYLVDGNGALSFSDQRYQEKLTVRDVLMKTVPDSQAKEITVVSSGRIAVYRGHVVGVADCSGLPSDVDGEEAQSYAITVGIGKPKTWQEAQTKLTQFMKKFLPAAAKAEGC
ncbi:hypothetical protein [Streptomyces spongiae]|uniref:DUF3558 domain-containing protein n=1 Tax=Streptomyces spongiae TaxID=565072 RepID=A0A5N8XPS2_9ACTN|nr:hypothetical protein [Streptomyces spongiae]MPY61412.1 hypothetical protein [Streptomyces spongiae]